MTRAAQPQAMTSQYIHGDQATHNANGVNRATSPQAVISALRTAAVPAQQAGSGGPASPARGPRRDRAPTHAGGLASMSRHAPMVT